jgi:hypothetical protein
MASSCVIHSRTEAVTMCIPITVFIVLAVAASQPAAGIGTPATELFEKKAELAAGAPALFLVEWSITPGFECLALLEKDVPQFKDFRGELQRALRSGEPKSRSAALLYLARLAFFVRTSAWNRDRDNGDDLFPVALGQHAQTIRSSLEEVLKRTQGNDCLLAAVALLASAPDHRAAMDVLLDAMRADDATRRLDACEWAGNVRLAQPRVVAALTAAIADEDAKVRCAAAKAAWNIGPKATKAVPALIELLKTGDAAYTEIAPLAIALPERRNVALLALGEMGADATPAVPVVVELLKGSNKEQRLALIAFLARFGSSAREAIAALRPYLASDDCEERLAGAATLLCIDPEDRAAAAVLVGAIKGKDKELRGQAMRACADATPKTKFLVPLLIAALDDPAESIRLSAARGLGKMGPLAEHAIPPLAALATDKRFDFRTQFAAVSALAGIGRASIPALVQIIGKPCVTEGQGYAAFVLGSFTQDAAEVVPVLTRALDAPALCMNAAAALGRLKKAAAPARETLTRASQSRNKFYALEIRVLASWALTQLDR